MNSTDFINQDPPASVLKQRAVKLIEIFDKDVCCPDGLCSDHIEPLQVLVSAQLGWIQQHGFEVRRYFRSENEQLFNSNPLVQTALAKRGEDALPLIALDGMLIHSGSYPDRELWTSWLGLSSDEPSLFGSAVTALAGVAAAVAGESRGGLLYHLDRAKKSGATMGDIARAAEMGLMIAAIKACGY